MPLCRRRRSTQRPAATCPSGCGRNGAICGVAAPLTLKSIAVVAAPRKWPRGARHEAYPVTPKRSSGYDRAINERHVST